MAIDMKKAMAGILNEGGSIFGELTEGSSVKLEVLKEMEGINFILGAFEVRSQTKKHKSPYVTMELKQKEEAEYTLYSGYGTAIGNKLMKLAKQFGKVDGNHYTYKDKAELEITFKKGASEAGEYVDMFAVEEEF